MKIHLSMALSLAFAALSCSTLAHDASLSDPAHEAVPDCSSLRTMEAGKMDINDPLAKALHDQCTNKLHQDAMHGHDMKDMTARDPRADQPGKSGDK